MRVVSSGTRTWSSAACSTREGSAPTSRSFVVDGEARSAGTGSALVRAVERLCGDRGVGQITMSTRRAGDFYKRLGYERTAEFYKKLLR
ncbi:GNAT family N-acetyltransferase [Clavibacter tessellarius]|uniref:GNAT family N-acetyltransferase n=1 Tax=Clavibacter tessellarius TaxID=31965 RepID=UPI003253C91C